MPLTSIQKHILDVIKSNRSPESYLAGGAVLNRAWPRLSDDLDIFCNHESEVIEQAQADIRSLEKNGLEVSVVLMQYALAEVEVQVGQERCIIQWMDETARRFFPILQDQHFGWRLHDADLAVNKIIAGASRSKVRDAVDLARIHVEYMPLGYVAWAAAGKTALSPIDILERVVKNAATHPQQEFAEVRTSEPVDGREIVITLMKARDEGLTLAELLPPDTYGCLFVRDGDAIPASIEEITAGTAKPWKVSEYGAWPNFSGQAPAPARRPRSDAL